MYFPFFSCCRNHRERRRADSDRLLQRTSSNHCTVTITQRKMQIHIETNFKHSSRSGHYDTGWGSWHWQGCYTHQRLVYLGSDISGRTSLINKLAPNKCNDLSELKKATVSSFWHLLKILTYSSHKKNSLINWLVVTLKIGLNQLMKLF